MAYNEAGLPVEVRFWKRIDKTDDCWNWTGPLSVQYGRIRIEGGRRVQVHRLSYEWATGTNVPDGLHMDHLCRNKRCVNPDHLEPVTPGENYRRGEAPSAVSHRTGRCFRGHIMDAGNTRVRKNGKRECRVCALASQRRSHARNREQINAKARAAYARNPEPKKASAKKYAKSALGGV